MPKRLPALCLALALAAGLACLAAAAAPASAAVPPEVRAKAAALFAALDRIEAESVKIRPGAAPAATGSRRLTFSEDELNAYAACRLEVEGEPYVKAAQIKLLSGDKIEGRISIDLGQAQASGLVPQKQDLLFAARIETQEGKIRINMDALYLGTQAISPAFVDIVIGIVARLQGYEPTTLKDWYKLPRGVQRLETRPGQVVVIY